MKILGLDLSTYSTGWCYYNDDIKAYGIIKPNRKENYIKRIIATGNEVKELLKKKSVEYVCIEELAVMRNGKTAKELAILQGHIQIILEKRNIPYMLCRPSEWRKGKIKGKNRKELKENTKKYIKSKYSIDVEEDEADAICIAEYGNEREVKEE